MNDRSRLIKELQPSGARGVNGHSNAGATGSVFESEDGGSVFGPEERPVGSGQ